MANEKARSFFRALGAHLKGGTVRFSAAVSGTLLLFGSGMWQLFREDEEGFFGLFQITPGRTGTSYATLLALGSLWGIAAALLAQLALERRGKALPWLPWAAVAAASAAAAALWYRPLFTEGAADTRFAMLWDMAYWGVLAAAVCLAVWLLYTRENEAALFGYLVKSVIFCGAVSLVVFLGLMLCLAASDALLFSVSWRAYWFVILLVWALGFPNLMFSYLPRPGETLAVPKAYTALAGYAALPVYLLLLGVLYGYLAKILITRRLPAGTMNWYASFALAAWVFFWLGLRMHPNALIRKFVRWGWALQLPVLAAQLVCIGIRLSAYGLTAARWLSLVCIGLGVAALVLAALQKGPRTWFLIAAVTALAVTLTPLNPMDAAVFSQAQRLKSALAANGMWDGSRITPAQSALSADDEAAISSSWNYLAYNAPVYYRSSLLEQAVPADGTSGDTFASVFGFAYAGSGGVAADEYRYYALSAPDAGVDVTGWSRLYTVSLYGDASSPDGLHLQQRWTDGTALTIDAQAYAAKLQASYTQNDTVLAEEDRTLPLDDGRVLVLRQVYFSQQNGVLQSFSCDGYLLVP